MFFSLLTLLLLSSVPVQKNELFFVEGDTLKIYNADLKLERIQIIHNPQKIKLDEMLTMNRQTGFYEMVEKMLRKI